MPSRAQMVIQRFGNKFLVHEMGNSKREVDKQRVGTWGGK